MQPLLRSRIKAVLAGLLASAALSSCSLPPSQAWQQIRQDGLLPFIANGMSAPRANSNLIASRPLGPFVVPQRPKIQPIPATTIPVGPSSVMPSGIVVNGLNGYVRTPFTNPARLVDVRGMNPGSKVVCPYTQRPFMVPNAAVASANPAPAPSPVIAQRQPKPSTRQQSSPAPAPSTRPTVKPQQPTPSIAAAPQPKPQVKPQPKPQSQPKTTPAPAPAAPKVAATPPTKPTPPISQPKVTPTPAPEPKPQQPAPTVAAQPKPQAPAKLPFGSPIPGRPGFVNSPYAEKHQLVDVTGLNIGTEVKCPYTGKLFRVPPQEQAKK